jgi:hypothetical protein
MNYVVPNLYDNLNLSTLPKIIKDEFYKIGSWMYTDEEIFIKPFFSTYYFDNDNEKIKFYLNEDSSYRIQKFIKKKKVLNETYDILTYKEFQSDYIKEFGRGFFKGYTKFSDELKNKGSNIFEPDNKQIAHKIFSKAIKKKNFIIARDFPLSFISFRVYEQIKKRFDNIFDYYYIDKKLYNRSGFETGEEYKAWEIILHNPTLFEDIFIEQLGKTEKDILTSEKKEEVIIETPNLTLKDIPNFNLQQRYEIFTQLGYDKAIHTLDTSKSSKNKIIALLMGISVDNAKHLINGTYKEFKPEDIEEFDEYLERIKVKL